jgi:hypothetical protein
MTTSRKIFEYGGVIAGVVLIAFGVAALVMSIDARGTVSDEIQRENIVGTPDMNPADTEAAMAEAGLTGVPVPDCDVAGEPIDSGAEARCFAEYLRIHALEASGGLTYAEMGRFLAADDPEDLAGTSDPAAALTDDQGNPVPNTARNTWVTATTLATALNVSFMAEQLALFGILVGIALVLTGVGFIVLAIGGALRVRAESPAARTSDRPVTAT